MARIVTLVTRSQAKPGMVFRVNIHPRCFSCKVFDICVKRLRPGVPYRVLEVRGKRHWCPLVKDEMVVVVVEQLPMLVAVEGRYAMEGVKVRYRKLVCGNRGCPNHEYCLSGFLEDGALITIRRVVRKLECPRGFDVALVEAEVPPL